MYDDDVDVLDSDHDSLSDHDDDETFECPGCGDVCYSRIDVCLCCGECDSHAPDRPSPYLRGLLGLS